MCYSEQEVYVISNHYCSAVSNASSTLLEHLSQADAVYPSYKYEATQWLVNEDQKQLLWPCPKESYQLGNMTLTLN